MSKKYDSSQVESELRSSAFFEPKHDEQPIKKAIPEVKTTNASTIASKHDSNNDPVQSIRKATKPVGKESLFLRITGDEKKAIRKIVRVFEDQGVRTSDNEVGRIAINYLLHDYQANKQSSVLAKVIASLNE